MTHDLIRLKAELEALHASMSKRSANSYKIGEIEQLRNKQRDLNYRIALLQSLQPVLH